MLYNCTIGPDDIGDYVVKVGNKEFKDNCVHKCRCLEIRPVELS